MSEKESARPGGLTALAIVNFIFGAMMILNGFGRLMLLLIIHRVESATPAELEENPVLKQLLEMKDMIAEMGVEPSPTLVLAIGLGLLAWCIGIVAGIGYLRMKQVMGRTLGNVFAITAMVSASLVISVASFGILVVLEFVYPLMTLFLLNRTFKENLVR